MMNFPPPFPPRTHWRGVCRAAQAGRCDALARDLLAMLRAMEAAKRGSGAAHDGGGGVASAVHATALKARALAAALGERRYYVGPPPGAVPGAAGADAAGARVLDARLLAFEFAQSIMLREVQVSRDWVKAGGELPRSRTLCVPCPCRARPRRAAH